MFFPHSRNRPNPTTDLRELAPETLPSTCDFAATLRNFSLAESSWVENWYILVLYLDGTRAKEIKRVVGSQVWIWWLGDWNVEESL